MKQSDKRSIKKYAAFLAVAILSLSAGCKSIAQDRVDAPEPSPSEVETPSQGQMLPITARADIKGTTIDLEVAATRAEQSMGLMFRPELPDNRGMLFPFEQARIARFWMNNVPVALDMVFIKEGTVEAIANSAPPCTSKPEDCPLYGPDTPVDEVMELRAGRAKELGLEIGDEVIIEYLEDSQ